MFENGGVTRIPKNKISKFVFGNRSVEANCQYIVKSKQNRVNLNTWVSPNYQIENVGDYLSYVIVNAMCTKSGVEFAKKISSTKHLYAIGSILIGYQDAVIWGSGFGYNRPDTVRYKIDNYMHKLRHSLDVRAVRGPITRKIILSMGYSCPEIYGDPAILLPLIYPSKRIHKHKYVVIPHYSKLNEEYKKKHCVLETFRNNWKEFVDKLLQADLVISSSLHGIIIAEAYGIPAIMLGDTPSQDITKYKDWYYSTERKEFSIAKSIDDALNIEPRIPNTAVIEMMQENLLKTFPKDLWK